MTTSRQQSVQFERCVCRSYHCAALLARTRKFQTSTRMGHSFVLVVIPMEKLTTGVDKVFFAHCLSVVRKKLNKKKMFALAILGVCRSALLSPGRWMDAETQGVIEVLNNNMVTLCTHVPLPWRQFINFTEGDGVVFLDGAVGTRGKTADGTSSIIWSGSFHSEWEKIEDIL